LADCIVHGVSRRLDARRQPGLVGCTRHRPRSFEGDFGLFLRLDLWWSGHIRCSERLRRRRSAAPKCQRRSVGNCDGGGRRASLRRRHKFISGRLLRQSCCAGRWHNPIFRPGRNACDIEFRAQRLLIGFLLCKNSRRRHEGSDDRTPGLGTDPQVRGSARTRNSGNRNGKQHQHDMHNDRCSADAGPVATVDTIGCDQQESGFCLGGQLS
jgi:hypothetical protein